MSSRQQRKKNQREKNKINNKQTVAQSAPILTKNKNPSPPSIVQENESVETSKKSPEKTITVKGRILNLLKWLYKHIKSLIGLIVIIVTFWTAYIVLLPVPVITVDNTPRPSDTFSTIFKVQNNGYFSMRNVEFGCIPVEVRKSNGFLMESERDKNGEPIAKFMDRRIVASEIRWNESFPTDCRAFSAYKTITPSVHTFADVIVFVTYDSAITSRQEVKYRFKTVRGEGNTLHWVQRPLKD
jgi:hypothetical protein